MILCRGRGWYELIIEESVDEESFINLPVDGTWTDDDIYNDYLAYKNKKSVAKRYCISVREVTEIIKKCHALK